MEWKKMLRVNWLILLSTGQLNFGNRGMRAVVMPRETFWGKSTLFSTELLPWCLDKNVPIWEKWDQIIYLILKEAMSADTVKFGMSSVAGRDFGSTINPWKRGKWRYSLLDKNKLLEQEMAQPAVVFFHVIPWRGIKDDLEKAR